MFLDFRAMTLFLHLCTLSAQHIPWHVKMASKMMAEYLQVEKIGLKSKTYNSKSHIFFSAKLNF